MSAALRAALLAVAVIALVPAAGVGTAVAQHRASATVTVTNFGSQPLFLNATYSTIESPGTASGPQMLQPNTSGTYVVTFPRLPGPGQVWLFRWGASNIFVGVSAVFLSGGGQDVQCGYTDANAGYDGERPVPWTSRCDATTQQGTGATTIIGTANVTDPPYPDDPPPACTVNNPAWANASDTGVQFNVDNATALPLNLVWGLLPEDEGDVDPPFPPPGVAPAPRARAAQQSATFPPLGPNSPVANSWQFSPPQIIAPMTNIYNFCAYDGTTAVGGSDTGTFLSVLYQIGTTDNYLSLGAVDPLVGSNQADCAITDAAGNPLSGTPFSVDCGISHGSFFHSVWHAVAWVTIGQSGAGSRLRAASDRRSPAVGRSAARWAVAATAHEAASGPGSGPRVVATVGRARLSEKAYLALWANRATVARRTALMRLTGETTRTACMRAVAANASGTPDPADEARRFCAPVGRPAPVGRRAGRREALTALILSRWISLEARRRGVRVPEARVDRRMALQQKRAGRRYSALLRAAKLSRRELRRQERVNLLAEQLGLVTTGRDDRARAARLVERLHDRWRPQTRCHPRFFVRDMCGRRL